MEIDLSAFEGLDENIIKVFQDPAVQERLNKFAEKQKEPVLNNKNEVLGKLNNLQSAIKEFGGMEAIKSMFEQDQEARRVAAEAALKSADVESVRKQAQDEIAKRDSRIQAMEQRELAAKTTSAINRAIRDADGVADLLEPHVRSRVRSAIDADGNVSITVLNADGTEMMTDGMKKASVKDLIADMKRNQTYQRLFNTTTPSGSGAKPEQTSGVENPYLPATKNYAKQQELVRSNPELAKSLAAVAGVKLKI